MQRRTTQRSSAKQHSSANSSFAVRGDADESDDKNKIRKVRPTMLISAVIIFAFAVFGTRSFLTPSQKIELVQAEHRVEDWLQNRQGAARLKKEPQTRTTNDQKSRTQIETKKEEQEPPQQEEPHREEHADPPDNANLNRASSDAATARMEAQPSRWVDGEKALRKKLRVLYDIQMKGQSLGVPVLTRYMGEDIPAFVGTPDSTMNEEEWKKLVDAKYEEMTKEEEEWRKKIALLIETKDRDVGITTP